MKQFLTVLCALLCFPMLTRAQYEVEQVFSDDQRTAPGFQDNRRNRSDSIQSQHKVVPRGLKVWTVDERFGDRTPAVPDTLSFMYMNSIFTSGKYGEYNTLGNLGRHGRRVSSSTAGSSLTSSSWILTTTSSWSPRISTSLPPCRLSPCWTTTRRETASMVRTL